MGFDTGTAVSGATSGATMGTSILPGWGTAIGAVVGGLAGGLFGGRKVNYVEDPYARQLSSLAQGDWTTYEARYKPMANQLAGEGAALMSASPTAGQSDINASFARQAVEQDRNYASYGLTPNADQVASNTRKNDLALGLAKVGIGNASVDASRRMGLAALGAF